MREEENLANKAMQLYRSGEILWRKITITQKNEDVVNWSKIDLTMIFCMLYNIRAKNADQCFF